MQEQLILENHNLVYHVLKNLNLYNQLDEYYDIALIGLTKAAKNYDDTKNIKFSTFAGTCIRNEIFLYLRLQKQKKKINETVSLDEVIYQSSNGECILLKDKIPSDENIEQKILYNEQIQQLYSAISALNQIEKFIIEHSYGLKNKIVLNQSQLAELTDMSQANVCRVKKQALKKIKEELKRYGYVCNTK